MSMTLLNRLLVTVASFASAIVASTANAQDKKPPVPPASAAPPSGPSPVAKPGLPSGELGIKPAASSSGKMAPAATPPAAGAPPAMPAPKPAPELDQLKFLLGKWRCEGKQFASPVFGPEHSFKATAENKPDVDGFWNQFMYEEKKSKEHHGFKVHGLWGWDQAGKQLVRAGASSDGSWDSATSPGMEGDKIVWTGEFSGPQGRLAFRHTFTKRSEKEWGHFLELKDPSGKWNPVEDVSCKR
jgi:hypothetical protein